jgi:3D (Asp-Asp-Asp) domain-containing protein
MVMGRGVGLHKQDFLYGGNGIIMEGTGRGLDGKYIQISNPQAMRWNPHYAGVSNPDDAIFEYTDAPQGAFCNVVENVSIAVDPTVLPAHHRVYIAGSRDIGERRADDTGGAIRKFHFDHYVGAGKSAINAWEHAGGNITNAKVKYLGL